MAKIKKGDRVIIIAGAHKGTEGDVIRCVENDRVEVSDVTVKKHVRPNPQRNIEGGVKQIPKRIHVSNVAIVNPITKKADRVGFKHLADGHKVRIYKSNNETIDV